MPKKLIPKRRAKDCPCEDTLHWEREFSATKFKLDRLERKHEYPERKFDRILSAASDKRWAVIFDLERRYRDGKQPLAAWDAIIFSREWEFPVPPWAMEYIYRSAKRIMANIPKGKASDHVAAALGLATVGQGNEFTRYLNILKRNTAVRKIMLRKAKKQRGDTMAKIVHDVAAEMKLTEDVDTIREWYKDLKNIL